MKTFLVSVLFLFVTNHSLKEYAAEIDITWVQKLDGNFSFAKKKSIECDAWCYEWAGTSGIIATLKTKDTVECYTLTNVATHCSLHLLITGNKCLPTIKLISIVPRGSRIYQCTDGFISIDQKYWNRRILKASFDLNFKNPDNDKKIYWKGKIFTKLK
jgi:hypothetical protein